MTATTPPGAPNLPTVPPLVLVVDVAGAVADADVLADAVAVAVSVRLVDPVSEAEGFRDGDVRSALLTVGITGGKVGEDDAVAVSVPCVLVAPELVVVSPGGVTTEPLGPGEGSGSKNEELPVLNVCNAMRQSVLARCKPKPKHSLRDAYRPYTSNGNRRILSLYSKSY